MIKQLIRIGMSAGISLAILALILQMLTSGLPDQQRPSVLSALQNSSLELLGVFLALYLIALFLRAYRYRLLIDLSGEVNLPSFWQMTLVTGIRNMMVDMFPARLGELSYVGLLNRGYGVKLQHCLSSLTVALAFDFIALLIVVLLVLTKQFVGAEIEGWAIAALISAMVLALIAVSGLFLIAPMVSRYLSAHRPGADGSLWAKLVILLAQFSHSLKSVRSAGKASQLIALSTIIRLLKYLGMFILFKAVAEPSFKVLSDLPAEHIVSALIGGEIGASLPIPSFMSFGVYEAGTALVFQLLGVTETASAFVTMLCVHIWSQLMEYLLGGSLFVVFVLLNRRAKDHSSENLIASSSTQLVGNRGNVGAFSTNRTRQLVLFSLATAAFFAGAAFLALQLRAATKLGSLAPPSSGELVVDADQRLDEVKQAVNGLNGFVVFSSNRDGNHDIFKLNLSDSSLSKLTSHLHTETYPRISPNGERLVFSRSHQPWVSQRNTVAWDIYLLDLNTGEESKVATNSTMAYWLNNSEISFLQDGENVVQRNVDTNQVSRIFTPGENNRMPLGSKLHTPKFNPHTKQLVFTALQSQIGTNTGHWGTAITEGETHRGVLNGCELGWNSAGTGLYQVTKGGRDDGLRIVSVDPKTLAIETLIDLEGEFSHEYWPKDSSNGEYMVFGASRGKHDHEHDTKDYEIFLWKVGSDSSKATRLTFHTGNDNWPDVYVKN